MNGNLYFFISLHILETSPSKPKRRRTVSDEASRDWIMYQPTQRKSAQKARKVMAIAMATKHGNYQSFTCVLFSDGLIFMLYVTRRVKKDMLSANTVLRYRPVKFVKYEIRLNYLYPELQA